MARDLEENNYYVSHGGKVPAKWTSPEASRHCIYMYMSRPLRLHWKNLMLWYVYAHVFVLFFLQFSCLLFCMYMCVASTEQFHFNMYRAVIEFNYTHTTCTLIHIH